MATDKAMMKTLIQNFSVEFLLEGYGDFTLSYFQEKVDNDATGSRFGIGKRLGGPKK